MMRIADVAKAFVEGRAAKSGNSRTDGREYVLHNTVIARKIRDTVEFNWGGWYTSTTANHMNYIIGAGKLGYGVSYATARDAGVTTFIRPDTNVYINIWHQVRRRWVTVYEGEREEIPETFRNAVALVDAADDKVVVGVGVCVNRIYSLEEFTFYGKLTREKEHV
jgi:hypothetical protein